MHVCMTILKTDREMHTLHITISRVHLLRLECKATSAYDTWRKAASGWGGIGISRYKVISLRVLVHRRLAISHDVGLLLECWLWLRPTWRSHHHASNEVSHLLFQIILLSPQNNASWSLLFYSLVGNKNKWEVLGVSNPQDRQIEGGYSIC